MVVLLRWETGDLYRSPFLELSKFMGKYEMTEERREHLLTLIQWYWNVVVPYANTVGKPFITKRDYEFLYQLYDNALGFYDDNIQERLNEIKNIYNSKEWRKQTKNGSHDWWKIIREKNQT